MTPRLVLSEFPGIDLFGIGFERAGYCVVRGPDPLFGGDIRDHHPPANTFEGIIGGSPCQDFSKLRRTQPTGNGIAMLREFERVVNEARPMWFLLENVPGVPDVNVPGYTVQRIHVRASEFGGVQHRLRVLQFGYRDEMPLILRRPVTRPKATEKAATASEGRRTGRRAWAAFCALQGLTTPPELASFTQSGKYRAVGNGVFIPMAEAVAKAIAERRYNMRPTEPDTFIPVAPKWSPCLCGCAAPVSGRMYATVACRKRAQRQRDRAEQSAPWSVTSTGTV